MSEKPKKYRECEQLMAGFLKPTVASQRRCNKQCSHARGLKNDHRRKKLGRAKAKNAQDQIDGRPNASLNKSGPSGLSTAMEMYAGLPLDERKPSTEQLKSHPELCEAKKMCEELKEQIKDLKLHQKSYEQHLKNSYHIEPSIPINGGPHFNMQKDYACGVGTPNENFVMNGLTTTPVFYNRPGSSVQGNSNRKEVPLADSKKDVPFQDCSNLPEQISYNSLFHKSDASDSIIKKLHSERDRYKRRVVKLQHELKLMKKNKSSVIKSPEISLNELTFYNADMIGEGRLAVVYEGTMCGKPVAVKKLIRSGVMTSSDRSYLAAEAGLLLPLQHRNIVALMGVCSSPMEPLIVTEFVNGKTLADMLNKAGGTLEPATFFSIARDTAIGLAYLHSQRPPVLHLNLRPSNVLVDSFLRAKVADYGFSKIRIDAGVSNCSNLAYLAPELLKFPAQITIKTDVYAFAILLWQMTTGQDPMAKRTTSQILDMMEHDQRLRIRSDLPIAIQQLICLCWDSSSAQRPTFKEIIIEFETLSLPPDWTAKLKEIGINRTDTSDLCSTRGSSSFGSSATSSSRRDVASVKNVTSVQRQPTSSTLRSGHFDDDQRFREERRAEDAVAYSGSNPAPLNNVRYVPHDLQSEINTPEIVANKSRHSSNETRAKAPTVVANHSAIAARDKPPPSYTAPHAWSGEPFTNDPRRDAPSRFDTKFRDYVSDACQAESTHKARAAYRRWPELPPNPAPLKSKSLLSSENIRVRSVDTPSCSTIPSSSNNSSLDTAVHVPPGYYRPSDTRLTSAPTSSCVLSTSAYSVATLADHKQADLITTHPAMNQGSTIVDNAKRLLSSSPLHNYGATSQYQQAKTYPSSPYVPEVKALPEYVSRYADHRRLADRHYVPSESSRSDVSAESFLPLPHQLRNHQCLMPANEGRTKPPKVDQISKVSLFRPGVEMPSSNENRLEVCGERKGDDPDFDDGKSDKVSRILTRTAQELTNASSMLYSATEELRKRKLNGTM